jgi:hypothetical protein
MDIRTEAQREAERRAATVRAVLDAESQPASVTIAATINLVEPLQVQCYGATWYEITEVRVSSLRDLGPIGTEENPDGKSIPEAVGFGRPVTSKGKPDRRESAAWHPLPPELVAPLLGRALAE